MDIQNQPLPYKFFLFLSMLWTIALILTLVPSPWASKTCSLGYKAICSFSPVSTVLCALGAGITCAIRKRKFKVFMN